MAPPSPSSAQHPISEHSAGAFAVDLQQPARHADSHSHAHMPQAPETQSVATILMNAGVPQPEALAFQQQFQLATAGVDFSRLPAEQVSHIIMQFVNQCLIQRQRPVHADVVVGNGLALPATDYAQMQTTALESVASATALPLVSPAAPHFLHSQMTQPGLTMSSLLT